MPDERLIPSRAFSRCRHRPLGGAHRSSLALCHRPSGTDMRPGVTPASPTSALATIAPVCHHLLLSCSDNACGARCVPPIAPCAMPHHQTHAGRTQGIPLSAAGVWEPLCGRVREHGRYISTYALSRSLSQTSRDLMVSSRAGRARGYHHYGSSG